MKRVEACVLLLAVAIALNACSAAPSPVSSIAGGATASLRIDPAQPVAMQQVALELTLRDGRGDPVTGAQVGLDLTMPAMAMPPNRPAASEKGNGLYTATALLTMAGEWQVRAVVRHPTGENEFTFLLHAK